MGQLFRNYSAFLFAIAFFFPGMVFSSDSASLTPVCDGCHGQDGVSLNSTVPTIAGQAFTLIEDNLLAFRDDESACASTEFLQGEAAALLTVMCTVLAPLGDVDLAALAEWYELQDFVPAQQPFDPALAAEGSRIHLEAMCEQCHSAGGRESNGMAAILAGQWTPYLERALKRFRNGEKKGPLVMTKAIEEFTDRDMNALLNFYASQGD